MEMVMVLRLCLIDVSNVSDDDDDDCILVLAIKTRNDSYDVKTHNCNCVHFAQSAIHHLHVTISISIVHES